MQSTSEGLSQLKFIAQIRPGTKIHVAGKRIEEPSWLTSFSRWVLWPDGRDNTYDYLVTTFTRSFEILNIYLKSDSISTRSQVRQILRDLRLALKGVSALKMTYKDDVLFCCKLDTLKEEVEARIEEMETLGITAADPIENDLETLQNPCSDSETTESSLEEAE